jgi:hypothetical protein
MDITTYADGSIVTETDASSGVVRVKGKVVKKFRGETAWMDAERYAMDLAFKIIYA